jgi:hypothetical protein
MSKIKQILLSSVIEPRAFKLFTVSMVPMLSDITSAAELPNFGFIVHNSHTHEKGVIYMRVHDSNYDSRQHDIQMTLGYVASWLEGCIMNHPDGLMVAQNPDLAAFDNERRNMPFYQRAQGWEVLDDRELLKLNAKAIAHVADLAYDSLNDTYSSYNNRQRGSLITCSTSPVDRPTYTFDFHMPGGLSFQATEKYRAESGVLTAPLSLLHDMLPNERERLMREIAGVQGTFMFQGAEYVFCFMLPLIKANAAKTLSKQMLINALDATIATNFPFMMPPRGADVGVKVFQNLKFNTTA